MPAVSNVVESSSLTALGYDDSQAILAVQFRDGAFYYYHGVPLSLFQALLHATSKGAYFNLHIRGRFPYSKAAGMLG